MNCVRIDPHEIVPGMQIWVECFGTPKLFVVTEVVDGRVMGYERPCADPIIYTGYEGPVFVRVPEAA